MVQNDCAVTKNYNGYNVSFLKKKNVMVNATEMAKPFNKRVYDWLVTQQSKDFISVLSETRNLASADLVRVTRGGDPKFQGTWMHEDVALEFARWLSPQFAIWCNDMIKELLLSGTMLMPNFNDPVAAARAWADEKEKSLKLETENAAQQKQLEEQKPKVDFAETIVASDGSISVNDFAKILAQKGIDIGVNRLYKYLRNKEYFGLRGKYRNKPYQKYIDNGFFEIEESTYEKWVNVSVFITPKGQMTILQQILAEQSNNTLNRYLK